MLKVHKFIQRGLLFLKALFTNNFFKRYKTRKEEDMKLLKQLYSIHSKSGKETKLRNFIINYVKRTIPDCTIKKDIKGNLYITRGISETYPVLVAHLDQVQDTHSSDFRAIEAEGLIFGYSKKYRRTEGLGADDKNGIWIALKCLKKYDILKVAFFVEEETGCQGSTIADMDFFKDARFVIEPDRRGRSDLITSIGGMELCSPEFLQAINYKDFGYKETDGLMTDIDALKDNGLSVSCINLSCGYYNPHTSNEFTVIQDLQNCRRFIERIIENCTDVYPHVSEFYGRGSHYREEEMEDYYDDFFEVLSNNPNMTFDDFYWSYGYYFMGASKAEMEMFFNEIRQDVQFFNEKEENEKEENTDCIIQFEGSEQASITNPSQNG